MCAVCCGIAEVAISVCGVSMCSANLKLGEWDNCSHVRCSKRNCFGSTRAGRSGRSLFSHKSLNVY
ncbi:hypothetical protein K443DRAFT_434571 [Laccaria amethystina LaAM-08-1]|uniref:Uncharacterized protein n=1 Tax=Laccaria amethystina LaAM-08-1 TaxID=1095629 RepID=A0A0C9XGX4_9AGAR|nr:hypothetical protein K443DRAFT_434571 [Laccaria amethystina LaAM-08-1]